MYTYERLCKLCNEESSDSDIAHYLLTHLDSLNHLTISKLIESVGVSRASLHRFYSKGGYESFKDLIGTLNEEVELKRKSYISYLGMEKDINNIQFDEQNLQLFIDKVFQAKHVVFYGNPFEIEAFKQLEFYLFEHHIDVTLLNHWNLDDVYQILSGLGNQDIFIMVETSWRIQGIYENSLSTHHILNLDTVNQLPFVKFFMGKADTQHYLNFYNMKVPYVHENMTEIILKCLDEKICRLLYGGTQ